MFEDLKGERYLQSKQEAFIAWTKSDIMHKNVLIFVIMRLLRR